MNYRLHSCLTLLLLGYSFGSAYSQAQVALNPKEHSQESKPLFREPARTLVRTDTIFVRSETAQGFNPPLVCDGEANLYLTMDSSGLEGIHKITPKGEKIAVFEASHNPAFPKLDAAGHFAVSGDHVYQLVYPHETGRYLFTFNADGTFQSSVKVDPGFAWVPYQLIVFPTGQFFVSGMAYGPDKSGAMWPFSGIFAADGHLLKEVAFQDDETLHNMAAAGDSRVSNPGAPQVNHAITNGSAEIGDDGNAYLMRWTDPAIIYSISPGGEVIRRFPVDPGIPGYRPAAMHIRGGRIAVLFTEMQTFDYIMKVMDLEGNEIATYTHQSDAGKSDAQRISPAFACYLQRPERFLFLGAGDDDRLQFWIAEGR